MVVAVVASYMTSWANIAQDSAKMGQHSRANIGSTWAQHSPKMGQDNAKMGQRSASIGQTSAHDADEAPRCGTHFQHYFGLCWAMLTHREQQARKKPSKTHAFLGPRPGGGYAFCFAEGEVPYRQDTANGASRPWPDRADAPLPATHLRPTSGRVF